MEFILVTQREMDEVISLYRKAIGTMGCTWDENYPSLEHTLSDISRGDLFCLRTQEGEIIGAISIDDDEEVEKLDCWMEGGAELSRLVVKESYQNKGIAGMMLKKAMEVLKSRGYKYVHFLVSKDHIKALKAYDKLNFNQVGEADLYGGNWWCYEQQL